MVSAILMTTLKLWQIIAIIEIEITVKINMNNTDQTVLVDLGYFKNPKNYLQKSVSQPAQPERWGKVAQAPLAKLAFPPSETRTSRDRQHPGI